MNLPDIGTAKVVFIQFSISAFAGVENAGATLNLDNQYFSDFMDFRKKSFAI